MLGADRAGVGSPGDGSRGALPPGSTAMRLQFAPGTMAVGAGGVWLADMTAPVLLRIDPERLAVAEAIVLDGAGDGPGIADVAVEGAGVWVSGAGVGVVRVDPGTNVAETVIAAPGSPFGPGPGAGALTGGDGSVYAVGAQPHTLVRIDVANRAVSSLPAIECSLDSCAATHGALWAADLGDDHILRLDPATGRVVATVAAGGKVEDLGAGPGGVWADVHGPAGGRDLIVRIDPSANRVDGSVLLERFPEAFHVGPGGTWEATAVGSADGVFRSQVTRIDPSTMTPVAVVAVAGQVVALAEGEGALWAGVWDPAGQTGRVLRIDPAARAVTAVIELPVLDEVILRSRREAGAPAPGPTKPAGADDAGTVRDRSLDAYRRHAATYEAATDVFTPFRRLAVDALALRPTDTVVDVGCGTGLCLSHLRELVGPHGHVIGIDQSPDMLERARRRVEAYGWDNVTLIAAPVEEAEIPVVADAVLFCATHDIMRSREALENVLGHLRPGGRVVASGAKWAPPWSGPLNLAVLFLNSPYVTSFEGFAQPWGLLADFLDLRVEPLAFGSGYLARGTKR